MDKPIQTDVDVHCAVCGSNTRVPGYGQQIGTLHALCESCFFSTLAYLRQERRIHTLFDDEQPADDQVFGRVARDDFFGES
ncbi:hypothetical protein N1078_18770 [Pseudomonas sp. MIL19]|uniref:hypothetical protein n=1 Tax=Pseudomonas sp. MIL19 TaxID=2976979 RepID=UPI00236455E9|nr:hypothetical protein [Pseudomonas sp. MIL19]MDD2162607.1 hypothetical protein [Pseudomonas sp. MIL19]